MKNQFTQNNENYIIQFSNVIKIAYIKIYFKSNNNKFVREFFFKKFLKVKFVILTTFENFYITIFTNNIVNCLTFNNIIIF